MSGPDAHQFVVYWYSTVRSAGGEVGGKWREGFRKFLSSFLEGARYHPAGERGLFRPLVGATRFRVQTMMFNSASLQDITTVPETRAAAPTFYHANLY